MEIVDGNKFSNSNLRYIYFPNHQFFYEITTQFFQIGFIPYLIKNMPPNQSGLIGYLLTLKGFFNRE